MRFRLFLAFLIFVAACSPETSESRIEDNDIPVSETEEVKEKNNDNNTPDQTTPKDDDKKINEPEEEKNNIDPDAVAKSLEILKNPSEDVIKCIDNDVFGLFEDVQNGYTPDEYEAGVVLNCFSNPEYYGPIDGESAGPPPGDEDNDDNPPPGDEDNDDNPPPSDEGVYEDYENFYTYFGSPGNQEKREFLSYKYFGSTSQDSVGELEAIFFGQTLPSDSTKFQKALYESGWLQNTCPFDYKNLGDVSDLGFVIDYNTPGITAIPMNDPGYFSRDKGLETLADPSAVLLDDGTIALYFTGDQRSSNQSARWTSTTPIKAITDSVSFQIESNYNLLTRTNWKNMFYNGSTWTAYGALGTAGIVSWYKWTSTDGLNWGSESTLLTAAQISTYREQNGYVSEQTASAHVTKISDSEYYAVFTGYREDFEKPTGTDVNGDGVVADEYIIIYKSTNGVNWSYHDVFHGGSEGTITKTTSGYYVLTSTTGCTYLSTDAKSWGYGFNGMLYGSIGDNGSSVVLEDGWRLVFGTSSNEGIPLKGAKIKSSSINSLYLKPMKDYLPSIEEIEVPYEFNY